MSTRQEKNSSASFMEKRATGKLMSYLERYLSGEHQPVWAELQALDEKVREESIYADAVAVAQETMRQVRQNIETLIGRLSQFGFIFGYDHRQHAFLEHLTSTLPESDKLRYYEFFCWVKKQPPVLLLDPLVRDLTADEVEGYVVLPDTQTLLAQLEREFGLLPLAVRAWYTEVGAVNFYGYCPRWNDFVLSSAPLCLPWKYTIKPDGLMSAGDPLQIGVFDAHTLEQARRYKRQWKLDITVLEFAPDHDFKGYSGGSSTPYAFGLPDWCADARGFYLSDGETTFVHYLRVSLLQWAGFPGMAQWSMKPEKDLALLTEGLLPF